MKNLKILRESAHLSQQKLGEMLHLSQQSIYKYENGHSEAAYSTLKKISNIFSVPIEVLINDDLDIMEYIEKSTLYLSESEKRILFMCRALDKDERLSIEKMLEELAAIG